MRQQTRSVYHRVLMQTVSLQTERCFDGTSKENEKKKVTESLLICQRTENSCSRWEIPCFTLGETKCQLKEESRKWLVPCSLRMSENVEISEKTAKILKNPKRSSRGRRCMFLGQRKEPHHQPHAKDENHHSVQLDDTRAEIHRKRKIRNVLGPSHRWRKPHATLGYSLSKTKRGLFVNQSNTRTLREQEFNRVFSCRRPSS